MDANGKINGKTPIFNDVSSFLWCKMNVCPRDTILNVVKKFYNSEEISSARDVLYNSVPENQKRETS